MMHRLFDLLLAVSLALAVAVVLWRVVDYGIITLGRAAVIWDEPELFSGLGFRLYQQETYAATYTCFRVPDWFTAVVVLMLMILPARRFLRRRREHLRLHRLGLGLCPHCAYDLRAHSPGQLCPECATPVPAHLPRSPLA